MVTHEKKLLNVQKIINNHINNYIKDNIKEYFTIFIIFVIGIVLGVIFINNSNEIQRDEIQNYLRTYTQNLNQDYEIDTNKLLKSSLIKNIVLAISLWFIGSTIIGIPIVFIIIGIKGFTFGYTISSIMISYPFGKGLILITSSLLLQNIIFIPAMFTLAVSCIKFYKSITKDKRRENIKIEMLKHTIFSTGICMLLIVGSLVETYVSTGLLNLCIDAIK